jgi:hypothetical protein
MTGSDPFAGARWKNASNQDGSCVDLALIPDALAVRDSKNPEGPKLAFRAGRASAFLVGVKVGRFDG